MALILNSPQVSSNLRLSLQLFYDPLFEVLQESRRDYRALIRNLATKQEQTEKYFSQRLVLEVYIPIDRENSTKKQLFDA